MFAVLQASPVVSLDALVEMARAFTPRFQVVGSFVVLDLNGLSAMFGGAHELGVALHAARPDCRAMAVASSVSAAMLLACGHEGLTVWTPADEPAALAALPLEVLLDVAVAKGVETWTGSPVPASDLRGLRRGFAIGWRHPRDTHQAQHTRRPPRATARPLAAIEQCASTLRRWGIRTLGALAALPGAEVHERLGEMGVSWQRLARGNDDTPLVPWLAEPIFEERVELEWPVEGFEPLSFVLARVLEPLTARLALADRGAVAIRTALGLTTRQVHVRVLPLPAPMRDPKTLRTLVLLDLESHPPDAPIDVVQVRLEPTPGRVLQRSLFERAQPAPEQVATLVARLTAVAGEGHVGSPVLVDAWKPGAFAMGAFQTHPASALTRFGAASPVHLPSHSAPCLAFRRFRLPVPVRVQMDEGRPVRVTTDRRGFTGGGIAQAAGPWRTSGEWWAEAWDRDEWDVEMADGAVYRLYVERAVGQWFLEGVFD